MAEQKVRNEESVRKNESDKIEDEHGSLLRKVSYFLSVMTVEPMLFFQFLGLCLKEVAESQMILYKTCREEKFNLSANYCSHIEEHTNDPVYAEIEKEVVNFNNIISLSANLVPVLLSFYIGSWSDKFGRIPFIALFMVGMLLRLVGTLFAGIFLEEMTKWVWLGIVMPVTCLSGGVNIFILVIYSFVSDNSTPRDRFIRVQLAGYMWDLGYFIAQPLGAWLYNIGGFAMNFGTGVGIYLVACFIGLIKLWGFKENTNEYDLTVRGIRAHFFTLFLQRPYLDLLSPMNLVESLRATFKKRPGGRSFYIICLVLLAFLTDLPIGVNSVEFMYVKRRFQWEVDKISFYSTILNAASNIGLITSMPIFHYFNINDSVIILLSLFSNMAFYLYKMLVKSENAFFASSAFGCMINLFYAPIRVQVTRCVSTGDLGKVFATMSSLQSLAPILGTALYTSVYTATADLSYPWQASYLLNSAGLFTAAFLLTLLLYVSLGCKQITSEEEEVEQNKSSSNAHPDDFDQKTREIYCTSFTNYGFS